MKLSARNQFKGTIIDIQEGAVNGIVKIDIGGGNVISSTISMNAIKELELKVGKTAYAVIKATSVMVGVDGTKAQQEAIRKGIEYGCVSQDAWQIGYDTMILALSAVEEDASEVEEVRLLEPGWLDASNIDLEENKKYLF